MSTFSNQNYDYIDEDQESVVREYETRYSPKPKRKRDFDQDINDYGMTLADERKWAALAHLSAWLILFTGFVTLGAAIPVAIFVPLVMYFNFRNRSDYVAYHALQAFALQVVCTVGIAVILPLGAIIWSIGLIASLLSMLVLVGFILTPIWVIAGVVFFLFVGTLPITMLIIATIAAINVYNGGDFRYPIITKFLDRWIRRYDTSYV